MLKLFIKIFICIITHSILLNAQWSNDPYVNTRVSFWGVIPKICGDGTGGAFIGFNEFSYDSTLNYLQRITFDGYLKFTEPIVFSEGGNFNSVRSLINSDSTKTIVGYISGIEYRDSNNTLIILNDPYVQRFDSNGNKLWGDSGLKLRTDTVQFSTVSYRLAPDNQGGVHCFWGFVTQGGGSYSNKLYIQHISSRGERLWGDNGIMIADSVVLPYTWMVSDDNGGVIVKYYQWYQGVYVQRYDSTGTLVWTLSLDMSFQSVIRDGEGGVIISGVEQDYPYNKLLINRISNAGEKLWGSNGIIIDDSVYNIIPRPAFLYLNQDSTISFFWDNYNYPDYDIYMQRFNLSGEKLWVNNLLITNVETWQLATGIVGSENNSNILFWLDGRESIGLYSQRINYSGTKVWGDSDKVITHQTQYSNFVVIEDVNEGAIVIWSYDEPFGGILAQQISKNGNLGELITSVGDEFNGEEIPDDFILFQNYPNPFNPSTIIEYQLLKSGIVTLKVYDILGREITTLINEFKSEGSYEINFSSEGLSSGVYIYRITATNNGRILFTDSKQMVLLR